MSGREFLASAWRPTQSGTLRGFIDLALPSGLKLHGCALHEKDGKHWIALPSKPQLDSDRRHRKDPVTGQLQYTPVVEILDRQARGRFQAAALAAVDRLRGEVP